METSHCIETSGGSLVAAAVPQLQDDTESGEDNIKYRQRKDEEIKVIVDFLENCVLPDDDKKARELLLSRSQYCLMDGVLYYVVADKTLRLVPPISNREQLFEEAHSGPFGAHLREAKVHGQLSKHYWWPKMRSDIHKWCNRCLVCATRRPGKAVHPPLNPIPVEGPFHRVGVDVIQFIKSYSGNQYAVVFTDYLTKWPEVFAIKNQTALTIAQLFVEEIICHHGVPCQLLSDRGAAFLSQLMTEVCNLLGVKKINTTAYHPQTNGLTERFNRTLTDMLAKKVDKSGRDWDTHLPFVLFAYRTSVQESTKESPFYLLYGRDPRLPTTLEMGAINYEEVDIDNYKNEISIKLAEAWKLARRNNKTAQGNQKLQYDRNSKPPKFRVGDRVFVYMPSAKACKAYKFARPFYGPYRIIEQSETGVVVRPVDKPQAEPIRVAYDRIQRCSDTIPDKFWPTSVRNRKRLHISSVPNSSRDNTHEGVDTGRSMSSVPMMIDDDRRCMELERKQMKEINCWKDRLWPRRNGAGGDT